MQTQEEIDLLAAEERRKAKAAEFRKNFTQVPSRAQFDLSHLKARPGSESLNSDLKRFERDERIAALRSTWGAPKKQLNRANLDREGDWGRAEAWLLSKCHSGFLIALVGLRGCGKTQLAVELMRRRTEELKSAWFRAAADFFTDIKCSFNSDKENEQDVMARYQKPNLLILDEAGQRSESAWENRSFFNLINKRYQDERDTLLISNQDRTQFETSVGASVISRINECGGIMECNWRSYRE